MLHSGFRPRCALEITGTSDVRIDKISKIIFDCPYSVHDISRTEIDPLNSLPRFNMPLELGLFLGCKKFGGEQQALKRCLVSDKELYRYQKFISDISGQDIRSHGNKPKNAVTAVRHWLREVSGRTDIPTGSLIYKRYREFMKALPKICKYLKWDNRDLPFVDLSYTIHFWLKEEIVTDAKQADHAVLPSVIQEVIVTAD